MKNALRYAVISAALVAGLAVTGASRADAGVSFSGTFPLPHGQISIGIGDPYFAVGTYVPVGYQVYARAGYGYGFAYHNRWIPVQPYGARWRVCGSPYFDDVYYSNVYYDDYYGGGYGGYCGRYYVRPSHRYAYRSYPRNYYAQHHYAPSWHRDRYDRRYDRHHGNGHGNGGHDRGNHDRNHGHGHGGNGYGDGHDR